MNPNVLVVVVDALRADRVGALGGRDLTPSIDAFAEESTIFTNAFSPSNTTDVAVTSIQTGRYPLSHGVVNHGRRVTDEEKRVVENVRQLPELLTEIGYRTAKFGRPLGRWHRRGFDIYPEVDEGRAAFDSRKSIAKEVEIALGKYFADKSPKVHDRVSAMYRRSIATLRAINGRTFGNNQSFHSSDQVEDKIVDQLSRFIKKDTPFYAFVHMMDTHAPFEAPIDLVRSNLDQLDYRVTYPDETRGKLSGSFEDRLRRGELPDIAEKYCYPDGTPSTAIVDAHYDAAVTRADGRIDRLLSELRTRSLLDDTLVVILSDHGESLTEHGIYYDHHGLYDVSTHVPLILRPPGGASGRVDDLVQLTDVAPTIADYAEVEGLAADGRSLRPNIENGERIDRAFVLAEEAHTQRRRMIRTREEKLIYLLEGDTICRYCDVQHAREVEYYDLAADPEERENLAAGHEEAVARLRADAESAAEAFERRRPTADGQPSVDYDDEEAVYERLEALGYR